MILFHFYFTLQVSLFNATQNIRGEAERSIKSNSKIYQNLLLHSSFINSGLTNDIHFPQYKYRSNNANDDFTFQNNANKSMAVTLETLKCGTI